ncbi:Polycomb group protein EMBRYONIC FLOWER 2 [Spatholobus suberectus]|nr:Polycomb group protein EMBRYONIC FLOWER 2 [Spatholobus suberectus]
MSHAPETSSAKMPAVPDAASEKYSRGKGQENHEVDGCEHLSAEEKLAAEESLSVYCKPVELYNYLRHRAIENPLFLQRCLDYRIKAKRKKRMLVTVSVLWSDDETWSLFPLCICVARLDPNDEAEEGAQKYQAVRIFTFRGSSKIDGNGSTQVQANFVLSKPDKLAEEAKSGKYFVLIFASVDNPISLSEVNASLMPWDVASNESRGGENCLYGKVSLKKLYKIWHLYPSFPLGQRIQIHYDVHLLPCILTYCFQRKSKSISIQGSRDPQDEFSKKDLKQLQVTLFTEKFGAREKSSDRTHASREVASTSSSLSHILWLKEGNVSFNYRYYHNKLRRMEVTEDFSCPFCLVKCATFKGLKWHLISSHDFFNFEFSPSEDCPSVYVSVKTNIWRPEIIADGVDPRVQTFIFSAKRPKHGELKNVSLGRANDTDPLLLDPEILAGDTELWEKADGSNAIMLHSGPDYVPPISDHDHGTPAVLQVDQEGVSNAIILHPGPDCVPPISEHDHGTPAVLQVDQEGVSNAIILHPGPDCVPPISEHDHGTPAVLQVDQEGVSNAIILHPGLDCVPPISEHDHGTPAVPQVGKRRKLPIENHDSQSQIFARLKKRNFYHSHKYQVLAIEEVLLDEDSEDEINEYAQEIEGRRKLAILAAANDERWFLPMWNSFIKEHRVLADGHINWAYEAFTKYHCAKLVQYPAIARCWRLLMVKLSNHGLLEARTFNKCNIILEQCRKLN